MIRRALFFLGRCLALAPALAAVWLTADMVWRISEAAPERIRLTRAELASVAPSFVLGARELGHGLRPPWMTGGSAEADHVRVDRDPRGGVWSLSNIAKNKRLLLIFENGRERLSDEWRLSPGDRIVGRLKADQEPRPLLEAARVEDGLLELRPLEGGGPPLVFRAAGRLDKIRAALPGFGGGKRPRLASPAPRFDRRCLASGRRDMLIGGVMNCPEEGHTAFSGLPHEALALRDIDGVLHLAPGPAAEGRVFFQRKGEEPVEAARLRTPLAGPEGRIKEIIVGRTRYQTRLEQDRLVLALRQRGHLFLSESAEQRKDALEAHIPPRPAAEWRISARDPGFSSVWEAAPPPARAPAGRVTVFVALAGILLNAGALAGWILRETHWPGLKAAAILALCAGAAGAWSTLAPPDLYGALLLSLASLTLWIAASLAKTTDWTGLLLLGGFAGGATALMGASIVAFASFAAIAPDDRRLSDLADQISAPAWLALALGLLPAALWMLTLLRLTLDRPGGVWGVAAASLGTAAAAYGGFLAQGPAMAALAAGGALVAGALLARFWLDRRFQAQGWRPDATRLTLAGREATVSIGLVRLLIFAAFLFSAGAQLFFGVEGGAFGVQPVELTKSIAMCLAAMGTAVLFQASDHKRGPFELAKLIGVGTAVSLIMAALFFFAPLLQSDHSPLLILTLAFSMATAPRLLRSVGPERSVAGLGRFKTFLMTPWLWGALRWIGLAVVGLLWAAYGFAFFTDRGGTLAKSAMSASSALETPVRRFDAHAEPTERRDDSRQARTGLAIISIAPMAPPSPEALARLRPEAGDSAAGWPANPLSLPEANNDFVAAMIIGRLGLATGAGLALIQAIMLALALAAALRAFGAVSKTADYRLRAARRMAGGFAFGAFLLLGLHWLISWSNVLGLSPVMGQPMSFVSCGRSHLLAVGGFSLAAVAAASTISAATARRARF